jgi:hypothetical protein
MRFAGTRSCFPSSGRAVCGWLTLTGVAVEKVAFHSKQLKLGDGKCLAEQRKSFVGHLDAIYFW